MNDQYVALNLTVHPSWRKATKWERMKLYINAMEGERVGVDEDNYDINRIKK